MRVGHWAEAAKLRYQRRLRRPLPARVGRGWWGLVGGRHFGSGKRQRWCVVCGKDPWCWPVKPGETGAKGQCDRKCQWPGHAACVRTDKVQRRSCPVRKGDGGNPLPGSVGPWTQLVFATPTATPLGVGDAACGYSAPPVTAMFQGAHEGVYQRGRARNGGRNGESRAARELKDLAGAR
jgi:hypothetical protein